MIKIPDSNRQNIVSDLMPDLTPLMDIVFMLIVFLILTVNSPLYSLDVSLPEDQDAVSKSVSENKSISIYLLEKGKGWKINKSHYSKEKEFRLDLTKIVQQEDEIIIISDKNSPAEKLISILTYLEKNKIEKISIAVEKTSN